MQVSSYIPAPYGGVSQAPPLARQPEQAELLVDCMTAIPQGSTKRPPWMLQAVLQGHPGHTRGLFERISRDPADSLLTVTNEAGVVVPRVYSMGGLPAAYSALGYAPDAITIQPAAQAYLNFGNPDPAEDLMALTVEDYTFIINRKVTVGILRVGGSPQVNPVRPPEAMLWVRLSSYGRTYTVTVTPAGGTPVTVSLTTPDGSVSSNTAWVDADTIAGALVSGSYTTSNGASISGNLSALTSQGFTVGRVGGVISLVRATGGDFTVAVTDGQGGQALTAIKTSVQRFSDLPIKAPVGFTVKIAQQSSSADDDFYVQFQQTAGPGTGIWQEVLAPGAQLGLDPHTMPVGLYYSGGWKLDVLAWKSRQTGDEKLAPDPDFVGQTLSDMSFHKGRLVIVSGGGTTLSANDDLFRLYPKTLSTQVASDPISLINPYPSRSTQRYAVPFDARLVVFADIVQLSISSQGLLTSKTGEVDILTTYEFASNARPQASNGKIYFVAPHGDNYSTVYEMATDRIYGTTGADDLSESVPRYIPAGVDRVANCPVNYTIVYGKSGDTAVYPHLFRYRDKQRVQNAFSTWNLPAGYSLGGMWFKNTRLYALACQAGKAVVVMADLAPNLLDPDPSATTLTYLDLRCSEAQAVVSYEWVTNRTRVTLPFPVTSGTRAAVRAPGGSGGEGISGGALPVQPEGALAPWADDQTGALNAYQFFLKGDWSACPLFFGQLYTSRHGLTRFFALAQDGTPLRSGRLSLRRLAIDLARTSFLRVEVTAKGRSTRSYTFTGYRYDDPGSSYDHPPLADAVFEVPLMGENSQTSIEFVNDSHMGHQVLGFEWRGEFNPKARRL